MTPFIPPNHQLCRVTIECTLTFGRAQQKSGILKDLMLKPP